MSALLRKEIRLSSLPLTWLFISFGVMTLIPGYPILCSVFFITLGIYQSFQSAREANDILYSALLPVAKNDVVKGKHQFVMTVELCGFTLITVLTLLRMTVLKDSSIYRQNALMNANLFYLGAALFVFGIFNAIFVGGFFRTAHKLGKPFVIYIIAAFLMIGVFEALHHFPGLAAVNAFGFDHIILQISLLLGGVLFYVGITYLSYQKACADFEKIDL